MVGLKRSKEGIIGGVCEGIGNSTDTNTWVWRLIFLFIPSGLVFYLVLWALLKEEDEA